MTVAKLGSNRSHDRGERQWTVPQVGHSLLCSSRRRGCKGVVIARRWGERCVSVAAALIDRQVERSGHGLPCSRGTMFRLTLCPFVAT